MMNNKTSLVKNIVIGRKNSRKFGIQVIGSNKEAGYHPTLYFSNFIVS